MNANDPTAIRQQVRSHLKVFWVLLLIVGTNVAATFLPVERPVRVGVQVALAVICAALVLTFYMHLLSETVSTYLLLGCTGFLFVALLGLILVARQSHPDQTKIIQAPIATAGVAAAEGEHVP
jgi:FtsH-binding integral membrane protein